MKTKNLILLLLLFLFINGAVYFITDSNRNVKVDLVLNESLKTLKTHYEILLQTQKHTASTIYKATINYKRFYEIMSQASSASDDEKELLRDELRTLLEFKYELAKEKGVFQYHFVLPNNESFLRMHKPEKYGDDLTQIRADFKYVNETQKMFIGFSQGRTSHGFRNVFPLCDSNGKHIGAMEVSFSSKNLQWYLNHISNIHTHFLVNKYIFDEKTWQKEDMLHKYSQSAESAEYMIALDTSHSRGEHIKKNALNLQTVKDRIEKGLEDGVEFSFYVQAVDGIEIISFFPIKDRYNRSAAWIVSFEKSPFIEMALHASRVVQALGLLLSIILIYFLVLQAKSKRIINDLLRETSKKAYIDGLTKVFNRNKFDEVLEEELQRVARYSNQLSIALIDIDHFKDFNDTYGHLVGDEVLVMLAQRVDSNLRGTDTFARWGGEEFIILFKETYIDTARIISLKLKDKIEALDHPTAGKITASFGLTQYIEGDTEESIFKRCDDALYLAKERGRNRVEVL